LRVYAFKNFRMKITDAFDRWRRHMVNQVDDRIQRAKDFIDERNGMHMDYIKDVKRTNMARVFEFM
jgi:hypothetical protein